MCYDDFDSVLRCVIRFQVPIDLKSLGASRKRSFVNEEESCQYQLRRTSSTDVLRNGVAQELSDFRLFFAETVSPVGSATYEQTNSPLVFPPKPTKRTAPSPTTADQLLSLGSCSDTRCLVRPPMNASASALRDCRRTSSQQFPTQVTTSPSVGLLRITFPVFP